MVLSAEIRLMTKGELTQTIRDREYSGTPLDWAEYNQQSEAVTYLRKHTNN